MTFINIALMDLVIGLIPKPMVASCPPGLTHSPFTRGALGKITCAVATGAPGLVAEVMGDSYSWSFMMVIGDNNIEFQGVTPR